jgi:hypothetical protein
VIERHAVGGLTSTRMPAPASRGSALVPSRAFVLRLCLHLAVWAPFVAGVVEEVRLGWRPVGDGAAIALRSWDSLTAHGPLVGQATRLAHEVYDPGPLEYWLLAIPVHIDPRYGVMWGAALWCMVAASLAIEAAWSALGGLGGFISAAVILGALASRPLIALQPFWNPWFGTMFLLAALAASWAALSGNRWWWVVLVVTASVASQAHLVFALPSVALVVVTLLVGLVDSLRAKSGYWWVVAGLIAGAGCWYAPFIQQLTGRPGNLAGLLDNQGNGPVTGATFGLKSLTASIQPPPLWWTVSSHVPAATRIADRPAGFAVAALIVTAAVLVIAVRPLRSRRLAALAAVSLLVSLAVLVTYSRIPVRSTSLSTLKYLDTILFPVGVLAWLVVGSAVVLAGRRLISRRRTRSEAPGTASAPGIEASGTPSAPGIPVGSGTTAAGTATAPEISVAPGTTTAPQVPVASETAASGTTTAPQVPAASETAASGTPSASEISVGSGTVTAPEVPVAARIAAPGTPSAGPRRVWAARAATLAAVVLSALGSFLVVAQRGPPDDAPLASLIGLASQRVEHALPRQPIVLMVKGSQLSHQGRLVLGLVWKLRVDGYRAQVRPLAARELGPDYVFRDQPLPQVKVHVRGADVSVRVAQPGPRHLMPTAPTGVSA